MSHITDATVVPPIKYIREDIHDEITKRLREENESLKKEMKMLYEKLADASIREAKLTLEVKVLRDAIATVEKQAKDVVGANDPETKPNT